MVGGRGQNPTVLEKVSQLPEGPTLDSSKHSALRPERHRENRTTCDDCDKQIPRGLGSPPRSPSLSVVVPDSDAHTGLFAPTCMQDICSGSF